MSFQILFHTEFQYKKLRQFTYQTACRCNKTGEFKFWFESYIKLELSIIWLLFEKQVFAILNRAWYIAVDQLSNMALEPFNRMCHIQHLEYMISFSKFGGEIFSTINGVPLHTAFHYHPHIILI